jgi:hypothetical protein
LLRWPSTVSGSGPSPNLMGLYCLILRVIFSSVCMKILR